MRSQAWDKLSSLRTTRPTEPWLETMLSRNSACSYLKKWGSPTTQQAFCSSVPIVNYEDIRELINKVANGGRSILFEGRPVGYEMTGGSTNGRKLIPYTAEGLADFRATLLPWLASLVNRYHISGSAYFSLSPACRQQKFLTGIPIGLTDIAYIGDDLAPTIASILAVPPHLDELSNIIEWRNQTLHYLKQAADLELISAWSPTFILRLFEGEDTQKLWPKLKAISCWADGVSADFIPELRALFPQATIEPKGLMSTEVAVTVPDESGLPVLSDYGFFEFISDGKILLENELEQNQQYEVVATTASGLYRYATGDVVEHTGCNKHGRPILKFIGRKAIESDLVGEKLTESFVSSSLSNLEGFRMLVPNVQNNGYLLVTDKRLNSDAIDAIEGRLMHNPQYAYARRLDQLKKIEVLLVSNAWLRYESSRLKNGQRLGDIKPVSLGAGAQWVKLFEEEP